MIDDIKLKAHDLYLVRDDSISKGGNLSVANTLMVGSAGTDFYANSTVIKMHTEYMEAFCETSSINLNGCNLAVNGSDNTSITLNNNGFTVTSSSGDKISVNNGISQLVAASVISLSSPYISISNGVTYGPCLILSSNNATLSAKAVEVMYTPMGSCMNTTGINIDQNANMMLHTVKAGVSAPIVSINTDKIETESTTKLTVNNDFEYTKGHTPIGYSDNYADSTDYSSYISAGINSSYTIALLSQVMLNAGFVPPIISTHGFKQSDVYAILTLLYTAKTANGNNAIVGIDGQTVTGYTYTQKTKVVTKPLLYDLSVNKYYIELTSSERLSWNSIISNSSNEVTGISLTFKAKSTGTTINIPQNLTITSGYEKTIYLEDSSTGTSKTNIVHYPNMRFEKDLNMRIVDSCSEYTIYPGEFIEIFPLPVDSGSVYIQAYYNNNSSSSAYIFNNNTEYIRISKHGFIYYDYISADDISPGIGKIYTNIDELTETVSNNGTTRKSPITIKFKNSSTSTGSARYAIIKK